MWVVRLLVVLPLSNASGKGFFSGLHFSPSPISSFSLGRWGGGCGKRCSVGEPQKRDGCWSGSRDPSFHMYQCKSPPSLNFQQDFYLLIWFLGNERQLVDWNTTVRNWDQNERSLFSHVYLHHRCCKVPLDHLQWKTWLLQGWWCCPQFRSQPLYGLPHPRSCSFPELYLMTDGCRNIKTGSFQLNRGHR